jgi:hypothetical protein
VIFDFDEQQPRAKADRRIEELYRSDAPWPRLGEALPAFGLALLMVWKTRSFALVWPCYAYIGYLIVDLVIVPQRKLTKWIRNGSAAVFTVGYVLLVLPSLGLPAPTGRSSLMALLAGAGLPYLYERGRIAHGFVQGLTLATLVALGAQFPFPSPLGLQVALPLFCAAYAWDERSVAWQYSVTVLGAYAFLVPLWLGGRSELLPHAIASLVAWALNRVLPGGGGSSTTETDEPSATTSTLGLRD